MKDEIRKHQSYLYDIELRTHYPLPTTTPVPKTKSHAFSDADNRIARYAQALAHPARVAIVRFLAGKNACQCGDIVLELPLAQSTVSQHLKTLKEAGLLRGTIDGPAVCYCLEPAALDEARALLGDILTPTITCCP